VGAFALSSRISLRLAAPAALTLGYHNPPHPPLPPQGEKGQLVRPIKRHLSNLRGGGWRSTPVAQDRPVAFAGLESAYLCHRGTLRGGISKNGGIFRNAIESAYTACPDWLAGKTWPWRMPARSIPVPKKGQTGPQAAAPDPPWTPVGQKPDQPLICQKTACLSVGITSAGERGAVIL